MQAPPDLAARGLRGISRAARSSRCASAACAAARSPDLVAFATGSLGEFLDRSLDSPHLKSLVLANSLYGKHGGPYDPGTLFGLAVPPARRRFGVEAGLRRPRDGRHGRDHGGDGRGLPRRRRRDPDRRRGRRRSASTAVARARRRARGRQRRSRPASSSRTRIRSAPYLEARAGGRARPGIPRRRARHQDGRALRQVQSRAVARSRGSRTRSRAPMLLRRSQFTLVPWLDGAQRCYGEARRGRIAEELWIDCLVPSLIDDSLATQGRHVMTCFVQYLPYRARGVGLEPRARAAARPSSSARSRASCRRSAARVVAQPALHAGGPREHLRHHRGQHLSRRPAASTSSSSCGRCRAMRATRRRSAALYLCGAGTHPGGGVTGAPGHNAAHRILADLKRDRALRRGMTVVKALKPCCARSRSAGASSFVLFVVSFVNYFLRNDCRSQLPSIQDEFGYTNAGDRLDPRRFNFSYTLLHDSGRHLRRSGTARGARSAIIAVTWGLLTWFTGFRARTHGGLGRPARWSRSSSVRLLARRDQRADLPDHDRPDRELVSAGTLGVAECADERRALARAGGARPDRDGADRGVTAGASRSTSWRRSDVIAGAWWYWYARDKPAQHRAITPDELAFIDAGRTVEAAAAARQLARGAREPRRPAPRRAATSA